METPKKGLPAGRECIRITPAKRTRVVPINVPTKRSIKRGDPSSQPLFKAIQPTRKMPSVKAIPSMMAKLQGWSIPGSTLFGNRKDPANVTTCMAINCRITTMTNLINMGSFFMTSSFGLWNSIAFSKEVCNWEV